MTGRSVPEWIGKTADTPVPPRVKLRIFEVKGGRCHKCGRKVRTGEQWICEHLQALINGGENRESNLGVTCGWCKVLKDAEDVEIKSKNYAVKLKHLGLKKSRRPIMGSRGTPFRKRMDGTVVKR